jgi:hypothetical protein
MTISEGTLGCVSKSATYTSTKLDITALITLHTNHQIYVQEIGMSPAEFVMGFVS